MRKTELLSAFAALAVAGAAAAQAQSPEAADPAGQQSQDTSSASQQAAAGGKVMTSDQHRATKVVGNEVQSETGESLGKVQELVFDKTGRITHVIIAHGGTLGMGQKLTAVPFEIASSKMAGDSLVLEQTQLKQAPSFDSNQWPNLTNASWSRKFDEYWKQQSGAMRQAAAPSDTTESEPQSQTTPPPQ